MMYEYMPPCSTSINRKVFLLFSLILNFAPAHAQSIEETAVPYVTWSSGNPHARVLADTTPLVLPFWEDFSQLGFNDAGERVLSPDTSKWTVDSENVRINFGAAIQPPTLGVATFDGIDANGQPYPLGSNISALTDALTSRAINLQGESPDNNLVFNFFWQFQGNGEPPELQDSIRLQFFTVDSTWVSVWNQMGGDGNRTAFANNQVSIDVENPDFFHRHFRFRFQSFGNRGNVDNWHIDYIFFGAGGKTNFVDRAFSSLPGSVFAPYTAIPSRLFSADPQAFTDSSAVASLYNLDIAPEPINYWVNLRDARTGNLLQRVDERVVLPGTIGGRQRRNVVSSSVNPDGLLPLQSDSVVITTEFYVQTGDGLLIDEINGNDTLFNESVNFRVNDTTRSQVVLQDYMAYDDGTAETGLEVVGSRIVNQFTAPEEARLTDIDIHFPAVLPSQAGTRINLLVLSELSGGTDNDNRPEQVLRVQEAIVQLQEGINTFTRFPLNNAVRVSGEFYVGYEVINSDALTTLGFDKNTSTNMLTFFSLGNNGEWRVNDTFTGTAMIRPVFRIQDSTVLSTGSLTATNDDIVVYPNPSDGRITVKGSVELLEIYNLTGQRVQHEVLLDRPEKKVVSVPEPGVYILKVLTRGIPVTRRLIIR